MLKQAVGPPSITKLERKRNDGTFASLGAITLEHWPVILPNAFIPSRLAAVSGRAREWPRQSSGEWARLGDSASVWAGYRGLTRTTTVGEEARWLRGCAAEQEAQLDSGSQPGAPDLTKTWQAFDSSKVSELANMGREPAIWAGGLATDKNFRFARKLFYLE